jgi:hypothetical protein
MLGSGDAAKIETAKSTIATWLARGRVPKDFKNTWVTAFIKLKRQQDLLDLTLLGIIAAPDSKNGPVLLEARAQAYLSLNQPTDAVSCARSSFNLGDLTRTSQSMSFLAMCLQRTGKPEDQARVGPMLAEMNALHAAEAATATGPAAAPSPPTSSVVPTVAVDGAPYAEALAASKAKDKKFGDRMSYGNLLLIAGHAAEAEKLFRELATSTIKPGEQAQANDGVARALRAQDGTMARAKDFAAAHPKQAQPDLP